jgi:cellulose synthase/poly-beta-1,6-N-acetylglucosamine synthase-like glycosyltransferase
MAYNEETNIRSLLDALGRQELNGCQIEEIVVVASGCTDGTEEVVRGAMQSDPRVRLLSQERREGKAAAVNLFLTVARGDVIVLESADTIPSRRAVQRLLDPFVDAKVGMSGARPRPTDPLRTVMGYASHFLWWMHHTLALRRPKLGEMVAFRNVVREIPVDTAVDEAAIEAVITRAGYEIAYAGNAIVHNKGPETLRDYLVQRRRIVAGHKHLHRTLGYKVSSTNFGLVFRTFGRKIRTHGRKVFELVRKGRFRSLARYLTHHAIKSFYVAVALSMEVLGHALGAWDYHVRGKNPYIWDVAPTTKRVRSDACDP